MDIVYQAPRAGGEPPELSIILIDWSVRESFHILEYLSRQDVPRSRFEVIWIEYYDRRPPEIRAAIDRALGRGEASPVDTWLVLDVPEAAYYHKHVLYNAGILASRGRLCCICDSDAIARPGFVRSILESFEADPGIVLHLDEVRNSRPDFYPFNFPSIEAIEERGCDNLIQGRPRGLVDDSDPLHLRNYGACMCARRDDLVRIGGADEHVDYLGHICGPYEMTFRLKNLGRREVWHPREWLYHVWHPGQAGDQNIAGPHDGRHMSTTALEIRPSARILPLHENPSLRRLREDPGVGGRDELDSELLRESVRKDWLVSETEAQAGFIERSYDLAGVRTIRMRETKRADGASASGDPRFPTRLRTRALAWLLVWRMTARQMLVKLRSVPGQAGAQVRKPSRLGRIFGQLGRGFRFVQRMRANNRHAVETCRRRLIQFIDRGVREVVIYETGEIASALCLQARDLPIRVLAVVPSREQGLAEGRSADEGRSTIDTLRAGGENVLVANFVNPEPRVEALAEAGIRRDRILVLQ